MILSETAAWGDDVAYIDPTPLGSFPLIRFVNSPDVGSAPTACWSLNSESNMVTLDLPATPLVNTYIEIECEYGDLYWEVSRHDAPASDDDDDDSEGYSSEDEGLRPARRATPLGRCVWQLPHHT